MRRMRFVLSVMLVSGSLVGCAASGTNTAHSEPGGSSVSSSAAQPSPSYPEDLPPPSREGKMPGLPGRPGDPSSQPAGTTTVTGTVTAGVEPGCMLLDGRYLLVGGPRDQLHDGARVAVTGRAQPDMMSTCQQGTPFIVESVKPA
ncbi:hypothetical protein [Planosporangium mesophilum]|uniref:hypothetical protein n=1 Tax=Planosporangium mesophilum TaxID=689768 RepID=UPI0035716795